MRPGALPPPAPTLPAMTTSIDHTCSDRVSGLLTEAASRARARGRRVLVSVTERMAAVDPLDALEAAGRHAADGRMYWTRPSEGLAIAALGAAATFSPAGDERYARVQAEWRALLEDALIEDSSGGADGVGPALFGGFSFDPAGPRDPRWQAFPSSLLKLPRLQVSAVAGACWLTTTIIVDPEGESAAHPVPIADLRHAALAASPDAGIPTHGTSAVEDGRARDEWHALVRRAVAEIQDGALRKVVLARARECHSRAEFDAFATLRHLRMAYPDCHVFGCWSGDQVFAGASPERLVRLRGSDVQASSLAGSAPRGATPAADAALAADLLESPKDRAEHALVRDALLAGLATLCDGVWAPDAPSLFTLPHVHHLHTAVRARLRAGRSLLDLVAQLHPTPAVGGSPRDAALRFIREHEQLDRGWYAGPIGWLGRGGGEFAVALRSALIGRREAWLYAGCGIVAGSDPDAEYAETLLKLRPMEQALAVVPQGHGA